MASGQGKTSVTAALARKLARQGKRVRVFKCGPDFFDPMLLERASGAPVRSLDLWMVGHELCRSQLAQAAAEVDVILIEGVMGLYDGTPSSADLSREFGVPVMAVIDAVAMAQTAGALVHGLRDYGPVEMARVIANRVASEGHARMVAASLRDIPLFATLPRQAKSLPERHLGLVLPGEVLISTNCSTTWRTSWCSTKRPGSACLRCVSRFHQPQSRRRHYWPAAPSPSPAIRLSCLSIRPTWIRCASWAQR